MTADSTDYVKTGTRRFAVWAGGLSGRIYAGSVRFDGERWAAVGTKHDVTEDVGLLVAEAVGAILGDDIRGHKLSVRGGPGDIVLDAVNDDTPLIRMTFLLGPEDAEDIVTMLTEAVDARR